jgi:outer membrane immunogenic protein
MARMLNISLLGVALLAANAAHAADAVVPTSAPSESRFAGFYVGGFVGYGSASFEGYIDGSEIDGGFPEEAEIFSGGSSDGFAYGGYLGYNMIYDRFLFGAELDVGGANIKASTADNGGNDTAEQEIDWFGSARLRAGALVGDRGLVFATGGVGYISSTISASNNFGSETGSTDFSSVVPVLGGGMEYLLTDRVSLRAEGLYFFPGNEHSLRDNELTSDQDAGDFGKVDGFLQLRTGISFYF